jgi:hypothetical protein
VGLGAKLGGLPLKGIIIYYYFLKAKVDMLNVVLSSCKGNVCKRKHMQLQEDKCRPGRMQLKLMSQPCLWSFFQPPWEFTGHFSIRSLNPFFLYNRPLRCFLVTNLVRTHGKTDGLSHIFHESRASHICLCCVSVIMVGCCSHEVPRLRVACCHQLFLTEPRRVLVWTVAVFGRPYPISSCYCHPCVNEC